MICISYINPNFKLGFKKGRQKLKRGKKKNGEFELSHSDNGAAELLQLQVSTPLPPLPIPRPQSTHRLLLRFLYILMVFFFLCTLFSNRTNPRRTSGGRKRGSRSLIGSVFSDFFLVCNWVFVLIVLILLFGM